VIFVVLLMRWWKTASGVPNSVCATHSFTGTILPKNAMLVVVAFLITASCVHAQRQGIKLTYANLNSPYQSFVTLTGRPHLEAPMYSRLNAYCDLKSRNCFRYDEIHDWGFNISATFEFNLTNAGWAAGAYQFGVTMFPTACAQVIVNSVEVFNSCGIYQSANGIPYDNNNTDWTGIRDSLYSRGLVSMTNIFDTVWLSSLSFLLMDSFG
jgi:hypothetical protein